MAVSKLCPTKQNLVLRTKKEAAIVFERRSGLTSMSRGETS
jgi:hypothetical protein